MEHIKQATEGSVLKAIVEAGQALYLAQESTANSIANGSSQEVAISQNFANLSNEQVNSAIQSFENYEAQVQAAQHTSFWGSLFGWVLTVVSLVASAFAGPEMFLFTVAMVIASKTGALQDLQNDLASVLGGSQLLAGILLTAALAAVGAGGGAAAGALADDASAVAEEAGSAVEEATDGATESAENASAEGSSTSESTSSSGKPSIRSQIQKAIGSLSRKTAGGLNGLGQGLQNFNVGSDIAQALAKDGLGSLGIALDVIVNLIAVASQSVGTGNGMIRAAAAGKGACGTSMLTNNINLLKATGVSGAVGGAGSASCDVASGVIQQRQAHALEAYIDAQGISYFFSSLKDASHNAFSAWIDSNESLEKMLGNAANQTGESISAVNTQLAIAMSSAG